MSLYPKQPTGPSALGTAQVRALDARGGDYQRSWRDSVTQILKQGEFRKVLVGADQYICSGFVSPTTENTRVTPNYRVFFRPSARVQRFATFAGVGRYLESDYIDVGDPLGTVVDYDYTALPPGSQRIRVTIREITIKHMLRSFYGGSTDLVTVEHFQYQAAATLALGFNTPAPSAPNRGVVAYLVPSSRIDAAGKMLPDIAVYSLNYAGVATQVIVDHAAFADPGAEFCPRMVGDVTSSRGFIVVAEEFYKRDYFAPPASDHAPKFWLLTYPIKLFIAQPVAFDISAAVAGIRVVPLSGTPPSTFFAADVGRGYNSDLLLTMFGLRFVVLSASVVLMICRIACEDTQWHARIARINVTTGATEVVYDLPSGLPGSFLGPYIGSAVYLGAGRVLAKQARSYETLDADVEFLYSADGGSTWTLFDPAGFDAPLLNQFFGEFTVELPRSADAPGVVLITAWDGAAYRVYESLDDGFTWSRRSAIATPTTFYPMADTPGDEVTSINFAKLLPGPNPARAIDPALPGRHT